MPQDNNGFLGGASQPDEEIHSDWIAHPRISGLRVSMYLVNVCFLGILVGAILAVSLFFIVMLS